MHIFQDSSNKSYEHIFKDSAKKILCTHFKTRLINLMHTFQDSSNKSYAHISRLV